MQVHTVAALARERGMAPEVFVVRLLAAEGGMVACIAFQMSEEDVKTVMRHPCTAIGSDAATTALSGKRAEDKIHPRGYGTFPRVLGHYARDEALFPLEEAVRKMTSLPAQHFGFERRGLIKAGYFADVAIFDPDAVTDAATFEKPHAFATGIPYVLVNGVVVIRKGEHTNTFPGVVITTGAGPK
jgi:N-acyl-D-amino-acid deacylase